MRKERTSNRNFDYNTYEAALGREAYEAILLLYVKKSLQQMMEEVARMDGYTLTAILLVVFLLMLMVFLLFWLADMVSFCSNRLAKLQKENQYLRQIIQEELLLDNEFFTESPYGARIS